MYEEIARQIERARADRRSKAMFHYQVLKHAEHLSGIEPIQFCRLVGVPDSYVTEFHGMMSVAKLIKEMGL